jgi:hypothetical protein
MLQMVLAVVSPQQWNDLSREGKLNPDVRVIIAKVGSGVFVKKTGSSLIGYYVKPTFGIINVITERVRKGDAADGSSLMD